MKIEMCTNLHAKHRVQKKESNIFKIKIIAVRHRAIMKLINEDTLKGLRPQFLPGRRRCFRTSQRFVLIDQKQYRAFSYSAGCCRAAVIDQLPSLYYSDVNANISLECKYPRWAEKSVCVPVKWSQGRRMWIGSNAAGKDSVVCRLQTRPTAHSLVGVQQLRQLQFDWSDLSHNEWLKGLLYSVLT